MKQTLVMGIGLWVTAQATAFAESMKPTVHDELGKMEVLTHHKTNSKGDVGP